NKTIGTQVDLLPTILDRLKIPIPADQLYQGQSLDAGEAMAGRLAYLNSYKEFGIISGDRVLLGDRESNTPSGVASTGAVYSIGNEGVKTVFTEVHADNDDSEASAQAPGSSCSAASNSIFSVKQKTSEPIKTGSAFPLSRVGGHARVDIDSLQDREKAMARFDTFQENLLHNYSFYREAVRSEVLARAQQGGIPSRLNL